MSSRTERRLAAIMFSDIVGYTALMAQSEQAGLRARERHRALLGPLAERYRGRIVDENGDELVLVFPSALDAVNCALAAQSESGDDPDLRLRIGIHSGDVVFESGRIYGDGVNVASRIRPLAEAGGICVSDQVYDSIKNQPEIEITALGQQELRNVDRPVGVFAVSGTAAPPRPIPTIRVRGGWRVRPWAVPAAVALVLLAFGAWWLSRPGADPGAIRSIAVLPLENISGDPEQEYFADGMTEALIGDLAKIGSLQVISRTSVMQYKGARKPLPEIAEKLAVDAVVEGTVDRAGNRVRITAQLIEARTDHHLWAERYERDLRDVLSLQAEVATAIAREIRVQLTPDERTRLAAAPRVDPAVHDLYLRGRFFWNQRSPEGLRQAIQYFERVVEADPKHARAHAGLADSYLLLPFYEGTDPRAALSQTQVAVSRALEIDESLAEAHTSLALRRGFFDWDFAEAESGFQRAIELDSSYAVAHQWYGDLLNGLGRLDEAVAELEHARRLDPLSTPILTDVGLAYATAGRYEEATAALRAALELDPGYALPHGWLGETYLAMGTPEKAVAEMGHAVRESGGQPAFRLMLARTYARLGKTVEAETILSDVVERSQRQYVPPVLLALAYRALGNDEGTFEWLEEAYESRDPWTLLLPIALDRDLLSDARFQDILRRHGFPGKLPNARGPHS